MSTPIQCGTVTTEDDEDGHSNYRCTLAADHTGAHEDGGFAWADATTKARAVADRLTSSRYEQLLASTLREGEECRAILVARDTPRAIVHYLALSGEPCETTGVLFRPVYGLPWGTR